MRKQDQSSGISQTIMLRKI